MKTRALIIAVGLVAATAAMAQTSNFSVNDEGWQIVSFGNLQTTDLTVETTTAVTYNATGGNPGGYISTVDPNSFDFAFAAPVTYLGNRSTVTSLSYDMIHPTGAIDYQGTDVILQGGGLSLLYRATPDIVPGVNWSSVSVSIAPASNWTVGTNTGTTATAANFTTVLGNLTGLFIRGEYTNGQTEVAGLDEVNFGPVPAPEPSSFLVLGTFAPCLLIARRRRRS